MTRAEVEQVVKMQSAALHDHADWSAMQVDAQPSIVIDRQVIKNSENYFVQNPHSDLNDEAYATRQ